VAAGSYTTSTAFLEALAEGWRTRWPWCRAAVRL